MVGLNRMFTGGEPIWVLTHRHFLAKSRTTHPTARRAWELRLSTREATTEDQQILDAEPGALGFGDAKNCQGPLERETNTKTLLISLREKNIYMRNHKEHRSCCGVGPHLKVDQFSGAGWAILTGAFCHLLASLHRINPWVPMLPCNFTCG